MNLLLVDILDDDYLIHDGGLLWSVGWSNFNFRLCINAVNQSA